MNIIDRITDFHMWLTIAIIVVPCGIYQAVQNEIVSRDNHKNAIEIQSNFSDLQDRYSNISDRISDLTQK